MMAMMAMMRMIGRRLVRDNPPPSDLPTVIGSVAAPAENPSLVTVAFTEKDPSAGAMNCDLKVPVLSVGPLGVTSAPPLGVLKSTVAPAMGRVPVLTCTTISTGFPSSGDPETGSKVTDNTDGGGVVVAAVAFVGPVVVVDVPEAGVGVVVVAVVVVPVVVVAVVITEGCIDVSVNGNAVTFPATTITVDMESL
jgi:hypothetical protein